MTDTSSRDMIARVQGRRQVSQDDVVSRTPGARVIQVLRDMRSASQEG